MNAEGPLGYKPHSLSSSIGNPYRLPHITTPINQFSRPGYYYFKNESGNIEIHNGNKSI